MGKFCKIVLSVIAIMTLFHVNMFQVKATEISVVPMLPNSVSENDTPPEIIWRDASNVDELMSLLENDNMLMDGGNVRVTDNLLIPADKRHLLYPKTTEEKPLIIDLGSHTLYVEGTLLVNGDIIFTGSGGKDGLVRIKKGGFALFNESVVFITTEKEGYSIWQEVGATLRYKPNDSSVGNIHFAKAPSAEVSTFEELIKLTDDMNKTGGVIRATDNLVVPRGEDGYSIWPTRSEDTIFVDMGVYTLYVEGSLRLQSGVEFVGEGGENGLIHVRQGGKAYICGAVLKAEDGYAVIQEEGAVVVHTSTADDKGDIQYAINPVAEPASSINWQTSMPVVLVYDDQTVEDALPKTDLVTLYLNGTEERGPNNEGKEIPVTWNLEPYRKQLEAKERVVITGNYPDAVAICQPVSLVVFQKNNPVVFLDCWGTENYGQPGTKVKVKLLEPEHTCRFEWSQDGKVWSSAAAKESQTLSDEYLAYHVTFPQEESISYPYYLSAVVDYPDGRKGYSDVLAIREARTLCGSGGNRGGGTEMGTPELPSGKEEGKEECASEPDLHINSTGSRTDDFSELNIPGSNEIGNQDDKQSAVNDERSKSTEETAASMPVKAFSSSDKQETEEISEITKGDAQVAHVVSEVETAEQKTVKPETAKLSTTAKQLPATEKSLLQTTVIVQMAAGIAVTGGIIVITIMWNPKARWIKRMRRRLSALFQHIC